MRHRRCSQRGIGQARNHVGEMETAIEAVFELGQIAGRVFERDCVIPAMQGILEIPQHGVDPLGGFRPWRPSRLLPSTIG